jgi:hypothetical protein
MPTGGFPARQLDQNDPAWSRLSSSGQRKSGLATIPRPTNSRDLQLSTAAVWNAGVPPGVEGSAFRPSAFGFRHSFVIRHWDFGL